MNRIGTRGAASLRKELERRRPPVEFALYGRDLPALERVGAVLERGRLYFGGEFCERLIPTSAEMERVVRLCERNRASLTWVTPYVSDFGLERLERVLGRLSSWGVAAEVVVNDVGVYRIVRAHRERFPLALGRLLTKQRRDPRILTVRDPSMRAYLDTTCLDNASFVEWLLEAGIDRVELDPVGRWPEHTDRLRCSLYWPYAHITTARPCPTKSCIECRSATFMLRSPFMPREIILQGKTQFFRQEGTVWNGAGTPGGTESAFHYDRLVYQAEIPC